MKNLTETLANPRLCYDPIHPRIAVDLNVLQDGAWTGAVRGLVTGQIIAPLSMCALVVTDGHRYWVVPNLPLSAAKAGSVSCSTSALVDPASVPDDLL